jgi:hypothetical protein
MRTQIGLYRLIIFVTGVNVNVQIRVGINQRLGALVHHYGLATLGFLTQPVFAQNIVRPAMGRDPDDTHHHLQDYYGVRLCLFAFSESYFIIFFINFHKIIERNINELIPNFLSS